MGSASIQGPLWGAQARTWAELAEPGQTPFYEAVFDALEISGKSALLDVGCGAGLALELAARRGATVTGLDASEPLLAIARERLPQADLRQGDLEQLPFPDASFTAVTSFNAVQYATRTAASPPRTGPGQPARNPHRHRHLGRPRSLGDARCARCDRRSAAATAARNRRSLRAQPAWSTGETGGMRRPHATKHR